MASKRRKKSEPAPGWAWMLFGLSIGLSVALVVYLKSGPLTAPDFQREAVSRTELNDRAVVEQAEPEPLLQIAAEPAIAGEAVEAGEDDLSFYEGLRNSSVAVNEDAFDFGTEIETLQEAYIQAGSFPTTQGADSRRASLAFLGYESFIEHAVVNGKPYRRVIIGPLSGSNEINQTRRRLRNEGIDTVLRIVTR